MSTFSCWFHVFLGRPRRLVPGMVRFITVRVTLSASRLWTYIYICGNATFEYSIKHHHVLYIAIVLPWSLDSGWSRGGALVMSYTPPIFSISEKGFLSTRQRRPPTSFVVCICLSSPVVHMEDSRPLFAKSVGTRASVYSVAT